MNNPKTNWAVNGDVDWAVYRAVDGTVSGAVNGDVDWSVSGAVHEDVDDAVCDDVHLAVRGAGVEDSPHPGLQDFLDGIGEAS